MIQLLLLSTLLLSCLKPADVANQSEVIDSMASAIAKKYPSINHMPVNEFKELKPNTFILVDVRSPKELNVSKIKGAISAKELEELDRSDTRGKHLIFYCTIGERSSQYALKYRREHSNSQLTNLRGSILAWIQNKGPLTDSSNNATKKVHVYSEAWSFVPKDYEPVWN